MKRQGIIYLFILSVLVLSLILTTACSLLPNISISPPSNPSPATETAPANPGWTLPATKEPGLQLPDFVSLVAKIKPSVVAINTEVVSYDIFSLPFSQEGAGSGWIIDEEGYVVTNNHVVDGARNITVTLDDGRTFRASVVGTDSLADIAVIKIDAKNLTKATIGDSSQLKIGEWVLAVGNSLNLGVAPSEGIVRSLKASLSVSTGQTLYGLIGTSAAINPGNSGGPLVNMRGEVVGITTVKIAMVGVEAMGWAISTEVAMPIIEALIRKGYVVRPWLGVVLRDVDPLLVIRYNLAVEKGVFVTAVTPGSPADKAGIKVGDVITGMGGKEISSARSLIEAIHASQIGQKVEITYWRGNSKTTAYTTLIESPPR